MKGRKPGRLNGGGRSRGSERVAAVARRPPGAELDGAESYRERLLDQNFMLRQVQEELQGSRDRYVKLYNRAPVGYMTLDQNGVIEDVNTTALQLLDTSREMIIRRPLLVFVHPEDRSKFLNYLLVCRSNVTKHSQWVELRVRRAGGGFAHVQLTSAATPRDSGAGNVLLTTLTDVSGRVALEQEGRRTAEQLAEAERQRAKAHAANEAKDRFLATLSHELRTPLTPALLKLSALVQDSALSEGTRSDLRVVLKNLNLEVRLIDDLLDINRILRGKFAPELKSLDLRDVIRNALETCCVDNRAHPVVDSFTYLNSLPVRGDQLRLQQVLWNVLANAIKFTPSEGGISVAARRTEETVTVRVTDTGIGIERDTLAHLGVPFRQADESITRRYGGLGLGLAIAKTIIEAHGGSLRIDSQGLDRGTTVTVQLPRDMAPAVSVPEASNLAAGVPASKATPRILLVEDHDDSRATMSMLLTLLGYEVAAVRSAKEAVDCAAERDFDLVISDVGLPDRDGYALMQELRDTHSLKGIALTGYATDQAQERSKQVGFAMHMVKPVTVEALERAITSVVAAN